MLLFELRHPVTETWNGQSITGTRTVTLCPSCHRDDPAAQGVLAFFALHERITADSLDDAAPLIDEWIHHVISNPSTYTDADLDDDIRQWCAGEM